MTLVGIWNYPRGIMRSSRTERYPPCRWWLLALASSAWCWSSVDSFVLTPPGRLSTLQWKRDGHVSTLSTTRVLYANKDDPSVDDEEKDNHTETITAPTTAELDDDKDTGPLPWIPPTTDMEFPPRWKLIAAYLGFLSFWPLLAFVQLYLRNHEFDIDTYLTVKGLLDSANTSPPMDDYGSSGILELPPLSPAERLVDSLFGPPGVDRRGF